MKANLIHTKEGNASHPTSSGGLKRECWAMRRGGWHAPDFVGVAQKFLEVGGCAGEKDHRSNESASPPRPTDTEACAMGQTNRLEGEGCRVAGIICTQRFQLRMKNIATIPSSEPPSVSSALKGLGVQTHRGRERGRRRGGPEFGRSARGVGTSGIRARRWGVENVSIAGVKSHRLNDST